MLIWSSSSFVNHALSAMIFATRARSRIIHVFTRSMIGPAFSAPLAGTVRGFCGVPIGVIGTAMLSPFLDEEPAQQATHPLSHSAKLFRYRIRGSRKHCTGCVRQACSQNLCNSGNGPTPCNLSIVVPGIRQVLCPSPCIADRFRFLCPPSSRLLSSTVVASGQDMVLFHALPNNRQVGCSQPMIKKISPDSSEPYEVRWLGNPSLRKSRSSSSLTPTYVHRSSYSQPSYRFSNQPYPAIPTICPHYQQANTD